MSPLQHSESLYFLAPVGHVILFGRRNRKGTCGVQNKLIRRGGIQNKLGGGIRNKLTVAVRVCK